MDTIFAVASGSGRAGVAVVRISGSAAATALTRFEVRVPEPRRSVVRALRDGDAVIDRALVLWFAGPRSFTGEDVAELHLHGSLAVVRRVLDVLSEVPGCRPAEAGEFTRRALEFGRMDLSQVEGLADLLEAETEAQRRQAMRLVEGDLRDRIVGWRSGLLRAMALIEASIDFADEELPGDVLVGALEAVGTVRGELERELAASEGGERLRHGFEVAIVGVPNVGKSTLLNRLAGRPMALTSEYAGTTRDVLEVRYDLRGLPVTFLDTAGVRRSEEPVERMGIGRSLERVARADLRVVLGDVPEGVTLREGDLVVAPKVDLGVGGAEMGVSGLTGEGVDRLLEVIYDRLAARGVQSGILVHVRQQTGVRRAVAGLLEAEAAMSAGDSPELASEGVRAAVRALDEVMGRVGVEDVLGEIFARFCIGK